MDNSFVEMEESRPVPTREGVDHQDIFPATKQDVEVYIRTYTTMLRSSGEVKVKALEQAHLNADSALHVNARGIEPDMSAFLYCVQRLPACITRVRRVLLGQSEEVFRRQGYSIEKWDPVSSPGRRRRWFWDGKETLAVYVSSVSDVDDLIPTLTGFQIEWNKFHELLRSDSNNLELLTSVESMPPALYNEVMRVLQSRLRISMEDWVRLQAVWGEGLWNNLRLMAKAEKGFTVRMLGGTYIGYAKATEEWWAPIKKLLESRDLADRPVYFVSSNTHALTNLLSGTILRSRDAIEEFIRNSDDPEMLVEYNKLVKKQVRVPIENMLYYASRRFFSETNKGREALKRKQKDEEDRGIHYIPSKEGMPIDAQVIELSRLDPSDFDPRISVEGIERLKKSRAILLNIDYPLGLAAYYIFVQVAESLENVKGVYVLGKAATLNARIGDVMISDSVFDEHTQNTYWLDNCFTAADVVPFLAYGNVLDNQKAVTVKGTYLQNRPYLDSYYKDNYTVVEMEAGPYLNAVYESAYPTRYPTSEHINFTKLPVDLGILHYASDTPYTRGKNLGAIRLAYLGMDSAYATSVAILRRIFDKEVEALTEPTAQTTSNGHKRKNSKKEAVTK